MNSITSYAKNGNPTTPATLATFPKLLANLPKDFFQLPFFPFPFSFLLSSFFCLLGSSAVLVPVPSTSTSGISSTISNILSSLVVRKAGKNLPRFPFKAFQRFFDKNLRRPPPTTPKIEPMSPPSPAPNFPNPEPSAAKGFAAAATPTPNGFPTPSFSFFFTSSAMSPSVFSL